MTSSLTQITLFLKKTTILLHNITFHSTFKQIIVETQVEIENNFFIIHKSLNRPISWFCLPSPCLSLIQLGPFILFFKAPHFVSSLSKQFLPISETLYKYLLERKFYDFSFFSVPANFLAE